MSIYSAVFQYADENNSSCLVSIRYGWANNKNNYNKWGPEEAYNIRDLYIPQDPDDLFDNGFDIAYSKLKPRGAGKAVQFRFESSPGKDMKLLGWAAHMSAGSRV